MSARSLLALGAALGACLAPVAALCEEVSPELQFCFTSLRDGERARAELALGPLTGLAFYRAELEVDPLGREVTGKLAVTAPARAAGPGPLFLRSTPNAFGAGRVALKNVRVNGQAAKIEHPEPSLVRLVSAGPAVAAGGALVELDLQATVPMAPRESASLAGSLTGGGGSRGGGDYGAFMAAPEVMSLAGLLPALPPADAGGELAAGPTGIGDLALYEPSNWLVSVTVPAGYRVHAAGTALGEVPGKKGRVRFTFAIAASRDFPLFVSRGYEVETATVDDIAVESHFASGDARSGKQALRHAASALVEFQKRLGPLPFRTFKVVEARLTGGAGGMEFPGLVTVSTALYQGAANPLAAFGIPGFEGLAGLDALPFDEAGLGKKMDRLLELTVAHEVAHQYFAGLVGSDPVAAPVVDEALAQHAALLYLEWKHGRAVADEVRQSDLVGAYQLYRLTGGKDGAADRATGAFASGLEYGALVYGKAPLLHDEERKLVGDAAYWKALRAYVDGYRFRWANRDGFTQELAKAAPDKAKPLKALRRRWWNEAHGDEDLGAPDLAGLIRSMTGTELSPEARELLEQLLPQLAGQ